MTTDNVIKGKKIYVKHRKSKREKKNPDTIGAKMKATQTLQETAEVGGQNVCSQTDQP